MSVRPSLPQYDASDRATEILARKGAAAPLVHLTYGYDPDGAGPLVDSDLRQREEDKVANTTTTYAYDPVDRLREAHIFTTGTGTTVDRFTYGYDANSNRTSATRNGQTTTSSFNAANELTSAGSTSYGYDTSGNLLSSSAGLALTYNGKDQTATVKEPGTPTALALAYGGADQWERVREGSTTFQNNALGLGVKIDGSGTRAYYTRDDERKLISQRLPSGRQYYVSDALGSVVALTDAAGGVSRRYKYDPYGNTLSTSGTADNPFRFAGEYQGAASLYKIGMRYYDASAGRWTQPDPLNQAADIRQANRYTYAGCDPVNFADPTGQGIGDIAEDVYETGSEVVNSVSDYAKGLYRSGPGGRCVSLGAVGAVGGAAFGPKGAAAGTVLGCAAGFLNRVP